MKRLQRLFLGIVPPAAALSLLFGASANAQTMSGSDGGMAMGSGSGMDMSAMMRPDAAPPNGVVGGMHPRQGVVMPSFSYMHMKMDGNRDGTSSVSTTGVLSQFPVAPLNMNVDMVMAGLMYGITDDVSVMGMVPYVWKSMDHVTRMGQSFTTTSRGIGDLKVIGSYDVFKSGGHVVELSLGLSFPTGSTDKRDTTPAGPNQLLPYPMQIGSGTFDLLPGVTYTGRTGDWSWGGQFGAAVRLGENDNGYTLGNVYVGSVWGARRWTDWVSTSVRLAGDIVGNIDGADPRLNPRMVPTADPNLRAGRFLSVGLGVNFMVPGTGPLAGTRLGIEGVLPVYQNVDGPQVERDYMITAVLRKAF